MICNLPLQLTPQQNHTFPSFFSLTSSQNILDTPWDTSCPTMQAAAPSQFSPSFPTHMITITFVLADTASHCHQFTTQTDSTAPSSFLPTRNIYVSALWPYYNTENNIIIFCVFQPCILPKCHHSLVSGITVHMHVHKFYVTSKSSAAWTSVSWGQYY
jgi:hypothetical protein